MKVDGIEVEITHPDRVLFPKEGITKAELAEYYAAAARWILPHVRKRPLNMQRFPRGVDAPGFVQQEMPANAPEWVGRATVEKDDGETTHVVCENAATLAWLANLSCITLHAWLSRLGTLQQPDRMIFDLDPAEDDFETARGAARMLKELLDEQGLPAYLMTTGSRGLHVTVPLDETVDYEAVRDYSQKLAAELSRRAPKKLTTEIQKEERKGRLFVDTLRNAYGHTAVAPYAVRARDGAPVATPIGWEMLDDPELTARRFTLRDLPARLPQLGGVWDGFSSSAVRPNV